MSFEGSTFIFNNVLCEEFGLELYNIASHKMEDGKLGTKVSIIEDRTKGRKAPLHYGVEQGDPLEFTLVFGVPSIDESMDRFDIMAVSNWLYGHKDYKWLEICQPDMENIRYRCIVTELQQIEVAGYQVAFEAAVQCDSPYAYIVPQEITIQNTSTGKYRIYNPSNIHDFYYPHMVVHSLSGTASISIYNEHEPDRVFTITVPPGAAPIDIDIDTENQIVTPPAFCENVNENFVRLLDGDNSIVVNGACSIVLTISPPVSVGC